MTTPTLVLELADRLGLDPRLPDACLSEADALARSPDIDDPGLDDLTELPFVTIDEPHSKDLDQALFVERSGSGWTAWYAIADAAHFVHPDSALFAEALRRGATFYLPGLVVPMLPRVLCEDLVSINPGVDRRALVFRMDLDEHGTTTATSIRRARVHSRGKLNYDGVQAWLDGRGESGCSAAEDSLRALGGMGLARMTEAESRDVVRVHRREKDLVVDGKPLVVRAVEDPRNDVERFNEQLSLLANIEGARMLANNPAPHVQPVYRTHEPPADQRMWRLKKRVKQIVRGRDPELAWQKGESLARYMRRLPPGPVRQAISRQAMRAGGRSGFAGEPAPHHGVGADVYARFTAPMREVVGVFVHKEMWELLAGSGRVDPDVQGQVIESARRARSLQRKIDGACERFALDQLFASRTRFSAVLLGIDDGKAYLCLDDPPLDAKLYLRDEPDVRVHGVELQRNGTTFARVGDVIDVRVDDLDTERNRWRLSLA
ncbi:MAG: RNB domain-containing ribonuclease [Proteobacteria bacterium]|nr:RNB domain-containing ribonuclease [Pseudomonadota bacterium]MCP4916335.1 RNB domain-containing ribonuclease [Pseudomonadota bacterium]